MSLRMIESIKRLRVTPTQKLVLFCLADCHNGDTGRCDPSYAHIMQITGLSNRAVATALQALRDVRVLHFDSRNGSRTSYQMTPQGWAAGLPAAAAPAAVSPVMANAAAADDDRAAPPPVDGVPCEGCAACESAARSGETAGKPGPRFARTCERASPPPVNGLHSRSRATCEPASSTCEPASSTCEGASLPPVKVLHRHGSASCEPAAPTCEPGSRPPVKEVHINRKESERTGSTGGRPPQTDFSSADETSAVATTLPQKLKPRREDWRDWYRMQARKANAVSAPLLAPPEFAESWIRYCDYRTRRATEARISSEAVAWTLDAAEAALRMCERHAATHGWPAVAAQVDAAIHARWQGLHFQTTNTRSSAPHAYNRPTPARSDSANTPGRYA